MTPDVQQLYEQVVEALGVGAARALPGAIEDARAADIAEVMDLLDDAQRSQVIYALPPRITAEVIVLLDEAVRGEVVEDLNERQLTEIVSELPLDDAADVVAELREDQVGEVLELIPQVQSVQISELLAYNETSAGGIMNPQLLSLPPYAKVSEAVQRVREFAVDEDIHYVYVVDDEKKLLGLVALQRLVINGPDIKLRTIHDDDPVTVNVTDDQEDVLHVFRKYDIPAVAVVDEQGCLRGRITYDDVMDVAAEEAAEDLFRMAGTDAAELETRSVFRAAGVRMSWLIPCMIGTSMIAAVLAAYDESSLSATQLAALVMFVPMIAATGGNAGIQSAAIVLRGLATGELASSKLRWVFLREAKIAVVVATLSAVFTGAMSGTVLHTLKWMDFEAAAPADVLPMKMATGIGLGVLCAILMATALGITLPFVFRRFGVDPAIASGPLITTINDIFSAAVYLGIALAILT